MNCKHCGSSYTQLKGTKSTPDRIYRVYHCDSCGKDFEVNINSSSQQDEWIMTLQSFQRDFAKIMRKPDGTIVCRQRNADEDLDLVAEGIPSLEIKVSNNKYSFWYSGVCKPGEGKYCFFSVNKVKLGPALREKAKTCEALRILADTDYLRGFITNPAALRAGIAELKKAIGDTSEIKTFNPNSGCYVATCVYGSYDCPQVWTLRRFRDHQLASTWYGRAFIRTYYALSPTLVKWFGETEWFKNLWKPTLDKMVAALRSQGVEDSPYDDLVW